MRLWRDLESELRIFWPFPAKNWWGIHQAFRERRGVEVVVFFWIRYVETNQYQHVESVLACLPCNVTESAPRARKGWHQRQCQLASSAVPGHHPKKYFLDPPLNSKNGIGVLIFENKRKTGFWSVRPISAATDIKSGDSVNFA
ncbi:hypothetical protein [Pseudomonas extremaustralis]